MKIFMEGLIIWAVAIMWLFLGADLAGQTSRVNGNLVGTVVDTSGAVVPDASIHISNIATGQTRSQQSDASGQFQVRELPSGSYRLVVAREGFSVYDNPNIAAANSLSASVCFWSLRLATSAACCESSRAFRSCPASAF